MAKVKNAPLHAGDSKSYEDVSYKTLVKYARQAVTESGLSIESSEKIDDETFMVMSKAKASAWSWGEIVRVVVKKEDDKKCIVRVYTKKRVDINITAKGDYSKSIFSSIDTNIEFGE